MAENEEVDDYSTSNGENGKEKGDDDYEEDEENYKLDEEDTD